MAEPSTEQLYLEAYVQCVRIESEIKALQATLTLARQREAECRSRLTSDVDPAAHFASLKTQPTP